MSKKAQPSFELKKIIWDIAATVGKNKPTEIQRQLDYELEKRRRDGNFFEEAPGLATIPRIVKEINKLEPDIVLTKLPSSIWKLRDDFEALKQLAKNEAMAVNKGANSPIEEASKKHLSEIRELLIGWSREIRIHLQAYNGQSFWWASKEEKIFPYVLQHCPSIEYAYKILMGLQSKEKIQDNIRHSMNLSAELEAVLDPLLDPNDNNYDAHRRLYSKINAILNDKFVLSYQSAFDALSCPGLLGDEMVQYQGTIERTFSALLNKSESWHKIIEYRTYSLQASLNLETAVNTCLTSNEYLHYKCDWCP